MFRLSRRHLLKGAAGIGLGLPALEAMGQSLAPPRRLVFVFTANGDQISQRMLNTSETGFVFNDMLTPFEAYRPNILVVDNVDMYHDQLPAGEVADGHEQGGSSLAPWKSGQGSYPIGGGGGATIGYVLGPSIDTALGARLIADNPSLKYDHLVYRVGDDHNDIWNLHAHAGPEGTQNPIPPEVDPFAAYTRLFSTLDTTGQATLARRLAMKQSALDLMTGELSSLSSRLGSADRARLDQHAQALRDLERSLSGIAATNPACQALTMPATFDHFDPTLYKQVGLLFFKIIAMAFACDLVRVVHFNWSGNTNDRVYSDIGMVDGHHTISHRTDDTSFGMIRAIKKNLFSLSTKLLDELKAIPEGSGTVFDNTLVVNWSELSEGDTHQKNRQLNILAGGAGGYFRMNRYLDFTNASPRGFSNLLISCWQYMGYTDVTTWGEPLLLPDGPGPLLGLT